MEVDVLFVGGGPANLGGAIHLANLIKAHNQKIDSGELKGEKLEPEILVLEKGANLGNHNLSGAVMNPIAFKELFPDIEPPESTPVTWDGFYFFTRKRKLRIWPTPGLSNHGNVILSISQLVRWLGEQAEATGLVNIFPGFAANEILMEGDTVVGVRTRDTGIDKNGEKRANFEPGMDLKARVTVLGEGTRGTLTRQLEKKAGIQEGRAPQQYALGVKEVWKVAPEKHKEGTVIHTLGWPLSAKQQVGGGWIYHMANNQVSIGLVSRLDYDDPLFNPFDEFQRFKTHPHLVDLFEGGEMIEYGAKSIPEGGLNSVPRCALPGCLIIGDSAGLVDAMKLKGIHMALKSGMLAAETIFEGLVAGQVTPEILARYEPRLRESYVGKTLHKVRNFSYALSGSTVATMLRVGVLIATGGNLLLGRKHAREDGSTMKKLPESLIAQMPEEEVGIPKHPLALDRLTSLFSSGTEHEENQPSHLVVHDLELCGTRCWEEFQSPCQRFCPAEVYEMEREESTGKMSLKLNPSNCVHCKTCDIKDPYENILWTIPEATGGPKYKVL